MSSSPAGTPADADAQQLALTLRQRLAQLDPQQLELTDDSARHAGHAGARGGRHYRLFIVSPHFTGKSILARHRLVYAALGDLLRDRIHALGIEAQAPDEVQ